MCSFGPEGRSSCCSVPTYLLPMGFNKQTIPPYTVSTYKELFHYMNTTFLVGASSGRGSGIHVVTSLSFSLHAPPSLPLSLFLPCSSPPSSNDLHLSPIYDGHFPHSLSSYLNSSLPLSSPSLHFSVPQSSEEVHGR